MSLQKAQKIYQKALKQDIKVQNEDNTHVQNHQWKQYKEKVHTNLFYARCNLAQQKLGYSGQTFKSAKPKHFVKLINNILKQANKIQEKELPKFHQNHDNQAKRLHNKGLYTQSDLDLIKEDIELDFSNQSFNDKWNKAVDKMRDTTERLK